MKVLLAVVGRQKVSLERDLCLRYIERATATGKTVGVTEVVLREAEESRAARVQDRCALEAAALRSFIPPKARLVALDEKGSQLSSVDFARDLKTARDNGIASYVLAIGGPDGLDPAFRASADLIMAFGQMTWPHRLARVMAAEQIYRVTTILSGHPYHRI